MHILIRIFLFALLFQGLLAGCVKNPQPQQPRATDPEYVNAVEFKLKMRELADQMLATTPNSALGDLVAMPTSFVDMDNKRQTSPLGNLIAESLIYEFNQRGFPVCEYRLTGNIDMIMGQGDFALLRQGVMSTVGKKWAALIVGTYYRTPEAVFVNARLVRANDGMVLRTGQLVLVRNALIERLTTPLAAPVVIPESVPAKALVVPTKAAPTKETPPAHSMKIVPAPWKAPAPTKATGPGLPAAPAL